VRRRQARGGEEPALAEGAAGAAETSEEAEILGRQHGG
jgi:hypothetical protein